VKPVVEHIETIVSQDKGSSDSSDVVYHTGNKQQQQTTVAVNANRVTPELNDAPTFPDESYLRQRINRHEPATTLNRMNNQPSTELGVNNEDSSFNNWMQSFRKDDEFGNRNNN